MIIEQIVKDASGSIDLVEHFSSTGHKLKQIETNRIYGASVIDAIPCRYTYEETDEPAEVSPVTPEQIISRLEEIL